MSCFHIRLKIITFLKKKPMSSLQNYTPGLKSKTYVMAFFIFLPLFFLLLISGLAIFTPDSFTQTLSFFPPHFIFSTLLILLGISAIPCSRMLLHYKRGRISQSHIEQLNTPFALTSTQGKIIYTNNSFEKWFPEAKDNLTELSPYLFASKNRDKFHKFVTQAWTSSDDQDATFNFSSEDQTPFPFKVRHTKQGNLVYWSFTPRNTEYLFTPNTNFQRALKANDLFHITPSSNVILDNKGLIQGYNATFKNIFLRTVKAPIESKFVDLLAPTCAKEISHDIISLLETKKKGAAIELEFSWGDNVIAYMMPISFSDGSEDFKGYYLQIFDNSEQRNIQLRLAHSQKLQALGQLAGGIAHDFNNLLTAMIGFCDLLLMRLSPGDQSFTDIMQIKQNANRATNLVRQLLAFSRQQTLQPTILDVSEVLSDLSILLQRLIGSRIELKITHDRSVDFIKVDRSQFEQVIINLVVNAKDAIIGEGSVRIITKLITLKKPTLVDHETMPAGPYIQIEVIDDGQGIKRKNLEQVFDPFFSTKDFGEGTGLGLATAYGTVKQTDGHISVDSTVGVGTKFTILLPQHTQSELEKKQAATKIHDGHEKHMNFKDLTGKGTILLAEDEDAVRLFAARALRDKGYTVDQAQNGQEALDVLKERHRDGLDAPDLLITDVVMPKMDGPNLVKEAEKLFPQMRVMFISGYAEDAFRDMVRLEERIRFLAKPFSLKVLASRVKETLEAPAPEPQITQDDNLKDQETGSIHLISSKKN